MTLDGSIFTDLRVQISRCPFCETRGKAPPYSQCHRGKTTPTVGMKLGRPGPHIPVAISAMLPGKATPLSLELKMNMIVVKESRANGLAELKVVVRGVDEPFQTLHCLCIAKGPRAISGST